MTTRPSHDGGCGGSCGCGEGRTMAHADDFVRPRFFAGQLLTEEDLGLLESYVVAKNRLHNRSFYGGGVVCGLAVSCNACDPGKVDLHPGYALDCCGNDIVVPCPRELDVNALVRELRLQEHDGRGCDDPCAEGEDGKKDGATRHYCLSLRYAERLEEPVAPYATDQSCDGPCEPSRVREGYEVALRCGPHRAPEREDVLSRIRDCIGDLGDLGRHAGAVLEHQRVNNALVNARRIEAGEIGYAFRAVELQALRGALEEAAALDLRPEQALSVEESYQTLETTRRLRQYVALARDASDVELGKLELSDQDIEGAERTLGHLLANVQAKQIVAKVAGHHQPSARAVLRPPAADPGSEVAGRLQRNLIKAGIPFDAASQQAFSSSLGELRDWLLARLEKASTVTSCTLRRDVASLHIDTATDATSWTATNSHAAQELAKAFAQHLIDCICAAMNPPCAPCDDDEVLLACLEVKDCEVVDVCNRVRTTVITGTALRYWLAPLGLLHAALEKLCCDFELELGTPPPPASEIDDTGRPRAVVHEYRHFVHPSESYGGLLRSMAGVAEGGAAGLDPVLETLRQTIDASGASPLDAIGLPGLGDRLRLPPELSAGLAGAAGVAVDLRVEAALADRPVDRRTLDAVRDQVVDELRGQDLGLASAEEVGKLRQSVNGFNLQNRNTSDKIDQEVAQLRFDLEERLATLEALSGEDDR